MLSDIRYVLGKTAVGFAVDIVGSCYGKRACRLYRIWNPKKENDLQTLSCFFFGHGIGNITEKHTAPDNNEYFQVVSVVLVLSNM